MDEAQMGRVDMQEHPEDQDPRESEGFTPADDVPIDVELPSAIEQLRVTGIAVALNALLDCLVQRNAITEHQRDLVRSMIP